MTDVTEEPGPTGSALFEPDQPEAGTPIFEQLIAEMTELAEQPKDPVIGTP